MELSPEDNIKASLRFLNSNNPYEQEYGLKVLINFTSKNTPDHKIQIVIYRIVPIETFATLLCSSSEVLQMLTAWLLFHLTIADVNAAMVLESGILHYVVPLLQSDTDDVTEKALLLTTNLSLNASYSYILGSYGMVQVLTGLIAHPSPLIAAAAAQPLRNLLHKDSCDEFEENQKIFCHGGGMKIMNRILSALSPPGEEFLQALLSVLHVLSIHNEIIRRIIAAAALITPLLNLMSSASRPNQELILKVLTNLSLTPETEPGFIMANALSPLVDMLYVTDASFTTKHLTVTILANLSCNEQIREMLRQSGLAPSLVELIGSTTKPDLLEPAVIVVTNLAVDEFIRVELWDAGAQAVMAHLATHSKVIVAIRDALRVALKNLSLPISEQVQAQIEAAQDESVDELDDLADQTLIIPLPGNFMSQSGFQYGPHAASSPPNPKLSGLAFENRRSASLGSSSAPNRNTLSSPALKPATTPNLPNRDGTKHVTPPPPSASRAPFTPPPPVDVSTSNPVPPSALSPNHSNAVSTPSSQSTNSPHYTSSPPPPLTRRPSYTNFNNSPRSERMQRPSSNEFKNQFSLSPSPSLASGTVPPHIPPITLSETPHVPVTPSSTPSSTPSPAVVEPSVDPPVVTTSTVDPTSPTLGPAESTPDPSAPVPNAGAPKLPRPPPRKKPAADPAKTQRAAAMSTLRKPVITESSIPQELGTSPPTEPLGTMRTRSFTKQVNVRRNHIAKEIFDTEQNYVRSLGVCIRVYLNPLLLSDNAPISTDMVKDVFMNIQNIFKLNCEFIKRFKNFIAKATPGVENGPTVGNVLISASNVGDVSFGELFLWLFNESKIISEYTEYINKFDSSRLLIESEYAKNTKFKDYLDKSRLTPECKGLTIQSLLIMPVQRIPRYILLLTDLAKNTPSDHFDFDALARAVGRTTEVAVVINEAKGRAESNAKTTILQAALLGAPDTFVLRESGRLLIKDGAMMMSEDRKKAGSKYSYLYLFSDILLFTRQQKTRYHFIRALPLVELKVVDIPPNETGQYAFLLLWSTEHDTQEKEFILSSTKAEDKEYWINGLKDAITAQKKTKKIK